MSALERVVEVEWERRLGLADKMPRRWPGLGGCYTQELVLLYWVVYWVVYGGGGGGGAAEHCRVPDIVECPGSSDTRQPVEPHHQRAAVMVEGWV